VDLRLRGLEVAVIVPAAFQLGYFLQKAEGNNSLVLSNSTFQVSAAVVRVFGTHTDPAYPVTFRHMVMDHVHMAVSGAEVTVMAVLTLQEQPAVNTIFLITDSHFELASTI
jgi:hypothetical protein